MILTTFSISAQSNFQPWHCHRIAFPFWFLVDKIVFFSFFFLTKELALQTTYAFLLHYVKCRCFNIFVGYTRQMCGFFFKFSSFCDRWIFDRKLHFIWNKWINIRKQQQQQPNFMRKTVVLRIVTTRFICEMLSASLMAKAND